MNTKQLNWLQIIVTAIIGGVVTVITGTILFRWQTSEPRLVYSTADTIPFAGQNQVVAIYQVSVSNDGKKLVEAVDCHISIPGAIIEQKRISADPAISYSDSVVSETLKLHVPMLNPSESVQLSLLATAPLYLPSRPEVSLRGKGVLGTERSMTERSTGLGATLSAALGGLMASFVIAIALIRLPVVEKLFPWYNKSDEGKHSGDQRQILAYLCSLQGLDEEVDHYLDQPQETSYWFESDRLAKLAIASGQPEKADQIKSVLTDLLEYASMASESQGIIYLNLARIEAAGENPDKMRKYFEQARKRAPKLVSARLRMDPQLKELKEL